MRILAENISLIRKTRWIMKLVLCGKADMDEVSWMKHMVDWTAVPISSLLPPPQGLGEQGTCPHCSDTGLVYMLCFG